MTDPRPPHPAVTHRDRGPWLVVFGAIEILIGLACLALIPLSLIAASLSPVTDSGVVISSLALYGVIAAIFVTLGIGSIRARRWAQVLTLSLSWVWLITGVFTMALSLWFLPVVQEFLGRSSGLDAGAARMVALGINLILGLIYIVLPGAFVLFYRSPDVIATCLLRDPGPGWTGRCPQPLFSLAVAYALGGLSLITLDAYGWVFPFFGTILSGAAGAVCWALVGVLSAALAWGTWRRRSWAWWTAMTAGAIAGFSSAYTFAVINPDEFLRTKGLLAENHELLVAVWPSSPWVHVACHFAIWGSFLAYLVHVKPLFDPSLDRGDTDA